MKRLIAFVLLLSLIFVMCACSAEKESSSQPLRATIVNKKGETEYLSAEELCDIDSGNSIAFESKYYYADVTLTGKVKSVEGEVTYNGLLRKWTIEIGDDSIYKWEVFATSYTKTNVDSSFLAELNVGDTVTVKGKLINTFGFTCEISDDVTIYKSN